MTKNTTHESPPDYIAPVINIRTGEVMDASDIEVYISNSHSVYLAGKVSLVFVSDDFPENVISLRNTRTATDTDIFATNLNTPSFSCMSPALTSPVPLNRPKLRLWQSDQFA